MKLRHRVKIQPVRELAAQESRRARQRRDRRLRMILAGEMRETNRRMREIRSHIDRCDRDRANARILDVVLQKISELALDLVAHAMRSL